MIIYYPLDPSSCLEFGNKSILGGTWAILRLWPFWDGENLTRTHWEVVNVTSNVLGGDKEPLVTPRRRGNAQRSSDAATCLGGMKHRSRRMSNCFTPYSWSFPGICLVGDFFLRIVLWIICFTFSKHLQGSSVFFQDFRGFMFVFGDTLTPPVKQWVFVTRPKTNSQFLPSPLAAIFWWLLLVLQGGPLLVINGVTLVASTKWPKINR